MRAKLAGALLTAIVALPGAVPAAANDGPSMAIADIRQEATDRSTRLTVECTAPLAYTYYSPDPLTLVIDIPEADSSKVPARINVGTKEVESLRVTSMARADGRTLARIEVRLASLVPYQIFARGKQLNLIFDRPAEMAAAAAKPEEPKAAPAPPPQEPLPPPSLPAATIAAEPPAAAQAPPPPAEAAPAGSAPASRILSVTRTSDVGQLSFTVRADGRLKYQDFFLGNPDRLVVDFTGVVSRASVRAIDVNEGPVKKVRLAQFSAESPKVARLVLDLSARAPYRIVDARDGVRIVFGEGGEAPSPAPLAALRASAPPPAAPAPAPALLSEPLPALPSGPLPAPADPLAQEKPGQGPADRTLGQAGKVYTGQAISLDFKEGDLTDIFRLFADISGLNVVVNPGISGKVTLKLNEVPWDQALDLILKTHRLGYVLEDNVLRIAQLTDLQREEQEKRKLDEEKALAGALVDRTIRISYAKAAEMSNVIKQAGAISTRGQVNVDERTNTLIIKDLQSFVERAGALVAELDRATPQVEIEARIIVTSRNFTRDLGIQWGFLNQKTPQFGNTTNLGFPHSIIINGQGAPGVSGISPTQGGLTPTAGIGTPAGRGYAVNLPATGHTSGLGVSLGNILGSFNIDAAITALERQGRGRVLSTPKVTTQNNKEAEITQGIQIPIQSSQTTGATTTTGVSFKDATLSLKVTPQITEASTIILALDLKNDTPDFANLVNGTPPINTQSAKTSVLVRDGATAVIGGIYQSQEQTTQGSTPFLGHLPILGYLFRNRFVTNQNNELLLFITPRIVKS
jgi:type IV pilus secretin PilQ/predicted competence protein